MTKLQANKTVAALEQIPVFFTEKMVADIESFSPSAAKPRQVMDSWLK